jgi:predicted RNA binding protein YcfA (HicA-like mRNA interferase family)
LPHESSKRYFCRTIDTIINQIRLSGYRQKGSHIRLTASINAVDHHITIPNHISIKIGTLNKILNDVAEHNKTSKEELIDKLF